MRFQTAPTGLGTAKLTLMVRFQTAPTGLELSGYKPHYVVRENGYRTHIPQEPVRLGNRTYRVGANRCGFKPHLPGWS